MIDIMKWEFFKQKLQSEMSDHLSDIDPDEIWTGIESEVDAINATNKRKSALLYFLLIGLVSGGALYFTLTGSNNQAKKLNKISKVETNQSIVANSINNVDQQESTQHVSKEALIENELVVQKQKQEESNQVITSKVITKATENKKLKLKGQNDLEVVKSNADEQSSSVINNINSRQVKEIATEMANTFGLSGTTKQDEIKNYSNASIASSKEDNFKVSNNPSKLITYTLFPINRLDSKNTFALPPSESDEIRLQKNFNLEDYQSKKKGFQFSVGLIAGVSKPIKILSEKESDAETLEFRSASETPIIENYFGAEFVAKHSSGFEIITGLSRHSIVEKFQYQFTYSLTQVTVESIEIDGDVVTIQQMNTTYRSFINKKYFNRQNYIQVPVMVGYKYDKGRWGIGIRSGLYANYLYSTSGKLADINGEDILLDAENDYRFESKFGMGVILGLTMDVDLSKHLTFSMSPNFRYNITDQSPSSNLSQKYMMIGGQVGLSYKFGR